MNVYCLIYAANEYEDRQGAGLFATRALAEARIVADALAGKIPSGSVEIDEVEVIGAAPSALDGATAQDADELDPEGLERAARALFGDEELWPDLDKSALDNVHAQARYVVAAYFGRA